ncbi:MAG: threonine synthase [Candidatus Helarchaeota archaeon]
MWLECINCHRKYDSHEILYKCPACGHLLDTLYDIEEVKEKSFQIPWRQKPLSVWRYSPFLPEVSVELVTLNEGGTNLYPCKNLAEKLGIRELWVKNEGENPTGSFKDRGMTVGVTFARELKSKVVACASTGNTSASLSAYAAKARMLCIIFIPSKKIAMGKLAQAMMYGSKVLAIKDNFDKSLELVAKSCDLFKMYLLNSVNPYRLEGQKTIGFEVVDQLGSVPDNFILPMGNCGNISAIYKGLVEWKELGIIDKIPRFCGIQASGSAPIVHAVKKKSKEVKFVENPETVATAIRIGKPVNWEKALRSIYGSNGTAEAVTDQEILEAQKLLARTEGIFVEPASASSIAGLIKFLELGIIDRSDQTVCLTTGHGLKDPNIAIESCEQPLEIEPDMQKIKAIIEETLAEQKELIIL